MFGQHHNIEARLKMRLKRLGTHNNRGPRPSIAGQRNPNWRGGRFISCSNCSSKIWRRPCQIFEHNFCSTKCQGEWQSQSSEFLALVMKSNRIKPNKKELALLAIIKQISLPYQYVGGGEFILGGKCPDYLNTDGQKKLIELFGDYWHQGQDPQERIDYFSQYGFQTLIIWESELGNPARVEEKLLRFNRNE